MWKYRSYKWRSLSFSVRDGLAAHPALLFHLPDQRLRQPADHRGPDAEQAHADRHQLLPAVAGGQRPHDGHLLHALHPHPKHPGGLHLRRHHVQDRLLLHGWGWIVSFQTWAEWEHFSIKFKQLNFLVIWLFVSKLSSEFRKPYISPAGRLINKTILCLGAVKIALLLSQSQGPFMLKITFALV